MLLTVHRREITAIRDPGRDFSLSANFPRCSRLNLTPFVLVVKLEAHFATTASLSPYRRRIFPLQLLDNGYQLRAQVTKKMPLMVRGRELSRTGVTKVSLPINVGTTRG